MYTLEYSRMEFNPTVKGRIIKEYPVLAKIFSSVEDKMARYVMLMYDSNSPVREFEPELSRRKEFCASVAGYDLEEIEPLKSLTTKTADGFEPYHDLLDCISNYLMFQNNRLWSLIVTNEQSFYEYQRRIMAEIGGEADRDALSAVTLKTKLLEAMDDIHKRLESYYTKITNGDKDLESAISKRKRVSPESIAIR